MRKVEQWSKQEVSQLPDVFNQYQNGAISKGAIRDMFKGRSIGAIKVKFNKLKSDGKIRQVPVVHPPKSFVERLFPSKKKTLTILEGNRLVTYQEV